MHRGVGSSCRNQLTAPCSPGPAPLPAVLTSISQTFPGLLLAGRVSKRPPSQHLELTAQGGVTEVGAGQEEFGRFWQAE